MTTQFPRAGGDPNRIAEIHAKHVQLADTLTYVSNQQNGTRATTSDWKGASKEQYHKLLEIAQDVLAGHIQAAQAIAATCSRWAQELDEAQQLGAQYEQHWAEASEREATAYANWQNAIAQNDDSATISSYHTAYVNAGNDAASWLQKGQAAADQGNQSGVNAANDMRNTTLKKPPKANGGGGVIEFFGGVGSISIGAVKSWHQYQLDGGNAELITATVDDDGRNTYITVKEGPDGAKITEEYEEGGKVHVVTTEIDTGSGSSSNVSIDGTTITDTSVSASGQKTIVTQTLDEADGTPNTDTVTLDGQTKTYTGSQGEGSEEIGGSNNDTVSTTDSTHKPVGSGSTKVHAPNSGGGTITIG